MIGNLTKQMKKGCTLITSVDVSLFRIWDLVIKRKKSSISLSLEIMVRTGQLQKPVPVDVMHWQ